MRGQEANLRDFCAHLGLALVIGAVAGCRTAGRGPDDPRTFVNTGVAYHGKGEYVRAIAEYNKAIERNPDLATAINNRGLAKYHLSHFADAKEDFIKVASLDPNYPEASYHQGLCRFQLGDLGGAQENFNRAIKTNPKSMLAYANRALVQEALVKREPRRAKQLLEAAAADLQKAAELGAGSPHAAQIQGDLKRIRQTLSQTK